MKQIVDVPDLADVRKFAYAQCATAGDFVFVAGQAGIDKELNVVSPEFGPQARQALANLRLALQAAGADFRDVVTMTVYVADIRHAHEFLEIRTELFGDDLAPSALIGGASFVLPGLLIEVQATAVRSNEAHLTVDTTVK